MMEQQVSPLPNLQPANLASLPIDILVQILDYFRNDEFVDEDRVQWVNWWGQSPDQTICNLRLTCRRLHDLASPLLFPVVDIELEGKSLRRVEELLSNRHIASGVLGLRVTLEYRPAELAADLAKFVKIKDDALVGILESPGRLDGLAMCFGYGSPDFERASAEQMHNRTAMRRAWDNVIEGEDGDEPDEQVLAYQKILLESHREYARLHEEQLQLIEKGTFVNTLASLLPKGQQPLSLSIQGTRCDDENDYIDNYWEVFEDTHGLCDFLTDPHAWASLDHLDGEVSLPQAKIISELPVALHKAGVSLRYFHLSCLPVRSNFSDICPGLDVSPDAVAWHDLQAACQQLKGFELVGVGWEYHKKAQTVCIPSEGRTFIEAYLSAVLSGQCLDSVEVDLSGFGLVDRHSGWTEPCHLTGAFASISWPCIKYLDIKGMVFAQEELERFCLDLSPSLGDFFLDMINLWDGSWVRTLDILREKAVANSELLILLGDWRGGELGQKTKVSRDTSSRQWELRDEGLVEKFRQYVQGKEGMENPAKA
ncbi:F-box domain-containing protein [Fusarium keratoplasticum]|uniref:F-box domain-containing protein n=1 Tax=Fusarium keratoplasticum TaxID=1328300 RepID=A0ACC0RFI1_9HYPO|nr:F-box domain-containing protein [Fusarium keratoplasticum]KAI8685018.1 F-box domain-containing protein [Fusarium keratoplasticum]